MSPTIVIVSKWLGSVYICDIVFNLKWKAKHHDQKKIKSYLSFENLGYVYHNTFIPINLKNEGLRDVHPPSDNIRTRDGDTNYRQRKSS